MRIITKRGFFSFFAGLPFVGAAFAGLTPAPDLDDYVDRRLKAIDGRVVERIADALAKSLVINPDTISRDTPEWKAIEGQARRLATYLGLVEFDIWDAVDCDGVEFINRGRGTA